MAWLFEFIHQCQASRNKICLLKLDFAKAFDTIEHAPMIKIMKQMGFDDRWLGWIKTIFLSGKSSVLLNGSSGRQFHCRWGVRQGDPLSPLIFVLAADLLQAAVNDAFTKGQISLPIPSLSMDYPVVQYADDTLLIMPACPIQAQNMKDILLKYAESIGLRINFEKSTLIPINMQQSDAHHIAGIFVCVIGHMPFTYLGLPLGTTRPMWRPA